MATTTKRTTKLGDRLHQYRLENDLTQEKLAQLLRLSRSTVHKVEHGVRANDRTAFKIEKLIGENANG